MRESDRNWGAGVVLSLLALVGMGCLTLLSGENLYGSYGVNSLGICAGIFAVCIVSVILVHFTAAGLMKPFLQKSWQVIPILFEAFFMLVILIIGIELRMQYYYVAVELDVVTNTVDADSYVYQSICNVLYLLLGSKFPVLPVVGFVCDAAACLFAYLGARKLGGRVAGVLTFAFVMLLPTQYSNMAFSSRHMFTLMLMLCAIWLFALYVSFEENEEKCVYRIIMISLLGIVCGILLFLDLCFAVMVLAFCLYLFFFQKLRGAHPHRNSVLFFLALIILSAGICLLLCYVKAVDLQLTFEDVCRSLLPAVRVGDFVQMYTTFWGMTIFPELLQISYVTIQFLGCVAVLYFAIKKDTRCIPLALSWLLLILLFSFETYGTGKTEYVIFLSSLLSGLFLADVATCRLYRQASTAEEPEVVSEEETEPEPVVQPEVMPKVVPDTEAVTPVAEEPAVERKVEFLENPLPEPKRHVPKELDFDIEVSEDDDFDI